MAEKKGPKVDESGRANARMRANQGAFLAAYAQTCHIEKAAAAAGIVKQTHYNWMHDDPEYPALFAEATELATQTLEDAAVDRALNGVKEPVFHEGKVCGHVLKYSDRLMELLLRARRREYRQKFDIEHTGKDGAPLIPLQAWDELINGAPSDEDTLS